MHRSSAATVFDLSSIHKSLQDLSDNTSYVRSIKHAIFPEQIQSVNVKTSSDLNSYVQACSRNIRAEIYAFCAAQINPKYREWRDQFEALEIDVHRIGVKDSRDQTHVVVNDKYDEIHVVNIRVRHYDRTPIKKPESTEELAVRLMYNLILFQDRLGILVPPSERSPSDSAIGRIVLGIRIKDPYLDPSPKKIHTRYFPPSPNIIHTLGYVGSYTRDLAAAFDILDEIHRSPGDQMQIATVSPRIAFLTSVACPREKRTPFEYLSGTTFDAGVPHNKMQFRCLQSMRTNVEGIQGPPGTGKSTTIFHLIHSFLPKHYLAIVTCVQNKAVDAIAEKLSKSTDSLPFIVVGNVDRVGETSVKYLLEQQVERDRDVTAARIRYEKRRRVRSMFVTLMNDLIELMDGNNEFRAKMKIKLGDKYNERRPWDRLWTAYVLQHRGLEEDVQMAKNLVTTTRATLEKLRTTKPLEIVRSARAVLCTIDTTSQLFPIGPMYDIMEPMPKVVIIDEAGTVPEYKMPLMALLGCVALVCIGDQNQLAPFTHCDDADNVGIFHRLSRALDVPMLTEQYRMHPMIAHYVSNTFYNGKLVTPSEIADARMRITNGGITWMDYKAVMDEARGARNSGSLMNDTELRAVFRMLCLDYMGVLSLIKQGKSVMVITFYKHQFFNMIDRAKSEDMMRVVVDKKTNKKKDVMNPPYLNVRFSTVDASQGSEADIVILSCVRCNPDKNIGFLSNRNRACVAISRAREMLIVVGSSRTLSSCWIWKTLYDSAQKKEAI